MMSSICGRLSLFNMKATNTFFTHQDYTTHTSYLPPNLLQRFDIIAISSSSFKRVRDCSLSEVGIRSDPSAICILLAISSITHTGGNKTTKSQMDWDKIINEVSTKKCFNERLTELNADSTLSYSPFFCMFYTPLETPRPPLNARR